MKSLILVLTVFISTFSFAQKTKKVNLKTEYPKYRETYTVLASNQTIKHGPYVLKFGNVLLQKGNYDNNKRIGIWEYYAPNGSIIHKVDVEKGLLIYNADLSKNKISDPEKYSQAPIMLGGFEMFYEQVGATLRYPAQARRMGTEGKVIIRLRIGTDGNVLNTEVVEGIGDGLDEESLKMFQIIKFDVLPALDAQGNPTESEIILPITFRLG